MQFASALSTNANTSSAVSEVCLAAGEALDGAADLAVVFVSHDHGPDFAAIPAAIRRLTGARALVGCTGESIVGRSQEIEDAPAISLWLAKLPGVSIRPMHLVFQQTPEGGTFTGWPDDLPEPWPADATMLLVAEPFSFPADALLERLGEDRPALPVIGGMASGAHEPGANHVFAGDRAFNHGAAAALVDGPLAIRAVVSQGCRPIGGPLVITRAERNLIYELGGRPALERLYEIITALPEEEQQRLNRGVHLGRVIDERRERFGLGDFLIRNCLGADRETGAIAIGDYVRAGQTVQFHVRDAASADEELRSLLAATGEQTAHPAGALMFTCNGRGSRMFNTPSHDAAAVAEILGAVPLAGFFAQGEIGPVGARNFVHGFTASVAVFSPK